MVLSTGLEPTSSGLESDALSVELRQHIKNHGIQPEISANRLRTIVRPWYCTVHLVQNQVEILTLVKI